MDKIPQIEKCPDCNSDGNLIGFHEKDSNGLAIYWCKKCNQNFFNFVCDED